MTDSIMHEPDADKGAFDDGARRLGSHPACEVEILDESEDDDGEAGWSGVKVVTIPPAEPIPPRGAPATASSSPRSASARNAAIPGWA